MPAAAVEDLIKTVQRASSEEIAAVIATREEENKALRSLMRAAAHREKAELKRLHGDRGRA